MPDNDALLADMIRWAQRGAADVRAQMKRADASFAAALFLRNASGVSVHGIVIPSDRAERATLFRDVLPKVIDENAAFVFAVLSETWEATMAIEAGDAPVNVTVGATERSDRQRFLNIIARTRTGALDVRAPLLVSGEAIVIGEWEAAPIEGGIIDVMVAALRATV